ncbi:taste receptor type 2 member 1 [Pteropus medius]|uniref:Taste receptor type 2 n=1 Tax=Pteropus vampyrus TaxID=132908 RepID=A0A6P3QTH3_PTEVA|nr:taste receptor type 2 member 1 [Pteropus vampyrus]XP_039698722.1 taste receptor type 2 member 1 [Pteropus giganteus]
MLESIVVTHLLFVMIQLLFGVLANGVIVVVTGTELTRPRKMAPLHLLLCCLAVSRICLQMFIFYDSLVVLSLIEFFSLAETNTAFMFFSELSLWLATWLSVFYCAKIATFAHPLFFWLKLRISRLVPRLIVGSLLYTSLTAVFHRKHTWILSQNLWLSLFSQNATTQGNEMSTLHFAILAVEFFLPLFIFLLSALLLIFSLGRHTQQMTSMAAVSGHTGTSVYFSTLLSMLSFLVLYVSQYVMAALIFSHSFKIKNFTFMFCFLVLGLYLSGHSIILIFASPKLKQNAKKLFFHSKCCQ